MDCIQPVAQIIIDRLWDPIALRVNYFANIGENIDNLRNEVGTLKDLTADLRGEVEREELKGMVPTSVARSWLQKADEIIKNAEEMQEEFRLNKKCFFGWCLDCPLRYNLGKRIVKATQVVQDHKVRKNSFGEIAVPPLRESVQELATTTIEKGTSTMGTLDQVWNWLMDTKTGKIGIWGKGGVGKTTLVKNIHNKLRGTRHFEFVIFVTVSKDWNIKKLRNDIGKEIGEVIYSHLSEEENETRASRLLLNKLEGKRFLLILDDVWVKVDLEKLGVPPPKENSCCKIVITTRNKGVCNGMETDKEIMVEVLSETEAWELFQEKAGSVISSDLEPIAWEVCEECHGLPLAIIVVGRALRRKTGREFWQNALEMLKTAQFKLGDMHDEVYFPLKFSYDHLTTDNLRNCFLYCSLFPEDYPINVDDLIEYWTMEGFIEEFESLKRASEMGHYILEELIDSCLLEKDKDEKNAVRLHDLIRDMAIRITSDSTERGTRFLARAGVGLTECPEVEEWEGKDRISLMHNHIQSLPGEPKCTELTTLLLQWNVFLEEIPQSFFKQMKNLRVLDLSDIRVASLPHSISELGSLQALILRNCRSLQSVTRVGGLKQLQLLDLSSTRIEELPSEIGELGSLQALILRNCLFLRSVTRVGRLKQLQLLDLSGTRIKELPPEIGRLTRLRRLDLSNTSELAYIPADIILSLSLLEDLEMIPSSFFGRSNESKAFIENLRHLNHLTHLSADIPNELCTSSQWKFQVWHQLKSFYLRIGVRSLTGTILLIEPKRRGRYLDITANANVSQEAVGLLQYAEILRLYGHDEVRTISAMGARNLMRLKACWVLECDKIENVVITEEAEEKILPNLEILVLSRLPELRSIWEGNGTRGSFGRIKNITLTRCDNVMHLFSSHVLQLLNSLEELNIISCPRMVEIVTGEVGNGVIALPRLRRIVLRGLLYLNRMWEGILSLGSLREIEVTSCTSLRQLAMDIEKTPALEVIKGEREWWDGLEWQKDSSKSHFQDIFKLVTHDDPNLYPEEDADKYFF